MREKMMNLCKEEEEKRKKKRRCKGERARETWKIEVYVKLVSWELERRLRRGKGGGREGRKGGAIS